jgi:predicted NBD/HSP70 family sugar kinase
MGTLEPKGAALGVMSTENARSLGTPSELGLHNRQRVVDAIRRANGLSRADVSRLSGLSRGAVTVIVQPLVQQGLLVEHVEPSEAGGGERNDSPGPSLGAASDAAPAGAARTSSGARTAGRRGVHLRLNRSYATAVGLEVADARVEAIVLDLLGGVRARSSVPFASDGAPDAILSAMAEAAHGVIRQSGVAPESVRGAGVALPGRLDRDRQVSLMIPGLTHWRNVPVVAELRRSLGLPVLLDWRAHTATLAEQWYGAGRECDDFLYVNVGDGMGMGIVLGGQLIRGATSMAGMLAHVQTPGESGGELCICGNEGCLQTRVAVPALLHRAERAALSGVQTVLTATAPPAARPLSFEDLVAAARAGDKLARNILEDAGETLGRTVADLVHLFNPPLVIVGGPIVQAGELVLDPLVRATRRFALSDMFDATRIVASQLRPGAVIQGAATLVLRRVLESDTNGQSTNGRP